MELIGKKSDENSGKLLGKQCRYTSGCRSTGAFDPARRRKGLSIIHSQLFDTREKGPSRGNQKALVGAPKRKAAMQERWPNEWHDIEHHGAVAKAPPCLQSTHRTPMPQQSSSSTREEEGCSVLMEDRRRQSVAFENVAKEMLRYLGE